MNTSRKSRYAKTEVVEWTDDSGETVKLYSARLAPETGGSFGLPIDDQDRLDLIAWRFYRDPTRFWRLCDASEQLDPCDVLEPGATIIVPPKD